MKVRLIIISYLYICFSLYALNITAEGEVYVRRNKNTFTNSGSFEIFEKDTIYTGANSAALIETNGVFYYIGKDSRISVSKTPKLESGIMFERKNKYPSLRAFQNEEESIKIYTDKNHFEAGKLNAIYILSKKNIAVEAASVRADALPLVKFNLSGKYSGFNIYRSLFAIHIGWREKKMPVSVSFTLPDKSLVSVKAFIECALVPPPPPKPEQLKGVTSTMTNILNSAQKSADERKMLQTEVYTQYNTNFYIKDKYIYPAAGRYSSSYGAFRGYTANYARFHEGFDIANVSGSPIYAANSGYVRIARDLFVRGGCVVIDHGEGLFSTYFHMSKIIAKEGDFVKQGDIIGEIGMTGMATGNHVHWEMRAGNICFDPTAILDYSFQFDIKNMTLLR